MEKRNILLFTIGLILLVSMMPNLAFAQETGETQYSRTLDWQWMGRGIQDFFGGILSWLLFDPGLQKENTGEVFGKALLAVILVSIIYVLVKKLPYIDASHVAIPWTISIAITILGVRFIAFDMLQAVLLPYGALAVIISMIIPFLLYFYFVEGINYGWFRKFAWLFYAAVMIGLWWSREDIQGVANIYIVFALAALALLAGDRVVQGFRRKGKLSKKDKGYLQTEIDDLDNQIEDQTKKLGRTTNKGQIPLVRRKLNNLQKRRNELMKELTK